MRCIGGSLRLSGPAAAGIPVAERAVLRTAACTHGLKDCEVSSDAAFNCFGPLQAAEASVTA
jgi:hypothetical protein